MINIILTIIGYTLMLCPVLLHRWKIINVDKKKTAKRVIIIIVLGAMVAIIGIVI